MQQEPGNIEEAPAAAPEKKGDQAQPGEKGAGKGPEAVAQQDIGGAGPVQAAAPMGQPGQAEVMGAAVGQDCAQSSAGAGGACADEQGSFQVAPEMMGGPGPGVGPQQMGPNPGPEYYYGQHPQSAGFYGSPTYGPPHMGGPGMSPTHASPCHHGYFHQQAGAHWQPPQGQPFVGPSPHEGQGAAHYGPFAEVVGKALQGQATPQDLVSGLLNLNFRDDQFWKGVVVGSVAALIFNSDSLRQTLAGALGSVFGAAGKSTQAEEKSTE